MGTSEWGWGKPPNALKGKGGRERRRKNVNWFLPATGNNYK